MAQDNRTNVEAQPLASIAVVGVGGIGSTFAHQLARAGHDVTAVARPGSVRLQQLRRDGGVVRAAGAHAGVENASMRVADGLEAQLAYDLVIVTAPVQQVGALLPVLERSNARHIQFMVNTFDPTQLSEAVGAGRCSFGMPFVQAKLDRDGVLDATISPRRRTLHGDARWAALFQDAGVPSRLEPDMPRWLRCHVPLCIALESIAVAAQQRGAGASWAEAMAVARGLHGAFAIVESLGSPLYPRAKAVLNACPAIVVASMLWTISRSAGFRELLATGVNECRALVDAVAAAATLASLAPARAVVLAMRPAEAAR